MILVTGATGFIGQQLVAWLVNHQYPICCLIHPAPRERRFAPGVSMHVVSGDVDSLPALRMAMHNAATVIHLAAVHGETANRNFDAINVQGTRNVIEAMREVGISRLITLSLIGADDHSAYLYLRSKGLADEIVRQSELDYTIIQSSAVYGPGDKWTEVIAAALQRLPFFPIAGDGRSRLQPIWVNDLVACFAACLTDPKTIKQTYVVGGPQHLTYEEIVNLIMEATQRRRRKRYFRPSTALSLSRLISGLLGGHLLYTSTDLDLLAIDRTTTLDAIAYQFGFTPSRMPATLDYLQHPDRP